MTRPTVAHASRIEAVRQAAGGKERQPQHRRIAPARRLVRQARHRRQGHAGQSRTSRLVSGRRRGAGGHPVGRGARIPARDQFAVGRPGGRCQGRADAEQQARHAERLQARPERHHQGGHHRQQHRDDDRRLAPDPIGQPAEYQQHRQYAEHIAGESAGGSCRAVAGKLRVGGVQRRLEVHRQGDQAQAEGQACGVATGIAHAFLRSRACRGRAVGIGQPARRGVDYPARRRYGTSNSCSDLCLTVRPKRPNSESGMHLRIDRNASEPLVQQIVAGVSGWIAAIASAPARGFRRYASWPGKPAQPVQRDRGLRPPGRPGDAGIAARLGVLRRRGARRHYRPRQRMARRRGKRMGPVQRLDETQARLRLDSGQLAGSRGTQLRDPPGRPQRTRRAVRLQHSAGPAGAAPASRNACG